MKAHYKENSEIHQCITLSLSEIKKNESIFITASYFWSNSANTFISSHCPMAVTLVVPEDK